MPAMRCRINRNRTATTPATVTRANARCWITECYLPLDVDGDGIAEWRKITRGGDQILDNVAIDAPPFLSLCPVPIPHLFFG